tara:strand:- start:108 stop:464 length:357 start_codon:yes stop_codon:yes gene_type:complete
MNREDAQKVAFRSAQFADYVLPHLSKEDQDNIRFKGDLRFESVGGTGIYVCDLSAKRGLLGSSKELASFTKYDLDDNIYAHADHPEIASILESFERFRKRCTDVAVRTVRALAEKDKK